MHRCRFGRVKPATRKKFWQNKRQGNVERDKRNLRKLRKAGWKVLVVWECQIPDLQKLTKKLQHFLSS
jgi:DNA mismatch endonuclease (patch repair protein)